MRDGGEEFVLETAGFLGFFPFALRHLIQPGVIYGDRGLRRKPFDDPLVTLREHPFIRVAKEQPAQHFACARDDWNG